ncbi:MAG: hypothetical protein GTO03_06855 [Planctomycetales bacterium]|nr:hypothetical protein [Planctomycetales bacterium]
MFAISLQQYQNAPFVFLIFVGMGLALHVFTVNWASNACLAQSVSYLRSAVAVAGLGVVNLILAHLLQSQQVGLLTPVGIAVMVIGSTMFLSAAIPAEPVNALLILILSTLVTAGAAYLALAGCQRLAGVLF